MNTLINERDAARRLGLSVATMRRRRLFRLPPTWAKLGGRVLYREEDLEEFVAANLVSAAVSISAKPRGEGGLRENRRQPSS